MSVLSKTKGIGNFNRMYCHEIEWHHADNKVTGTSELQGSDDDH